MAGRRIKNKVRKKSTSSDSIKKSKRYFSELGASFRDFGKNLSLLLPILFSIVLIIGFIVVVVLELVIIFVLAIGKTESLTQAVFISALKNPLAILLAIIFALVDFVLIIMINSWIRAMFFGMVRKVIAAGKVYAGDMFKSGKLYWWRYFKLSLLLFFMVGLPVLVVMGIVALLFMKSFAAGFVLGIPVFLGLIYIGLSLLFVVPMLFNEKKGTFDILVLSLRYFLKKPRHVILSALTLPLVYIVAVLIFFPITYFFEPAVRTGGLGINILYQLVINLFSIIISIIFTIFLFRLYHMQEPINKDS